MQSSHGCYGWGLCHGDWGGLCFIVFDCVSKGRGQLMIHKRVGPSTQPTQHAGVATKTKSVLKKEWTLTQLAGGFKYFLFSPRSLGRWPNLTNIFQMGWNHQLDKPHPKKLTWILKNWWFGTASQITSFRRDFWCLQVGIARWEDWWPKSHKLEVFKICLAAAK